MRDIWRPSLCWGLALWGLLSALGCARMPPQTTLPAPGGAAIPRQLQARQVIITLAPASEAEWAQTTAALSAAYDLPQAGAFPLRSLGVQCVVLQIPPGRSVPDTVQRLAADPRVESVQLNQVFQGLETTPNDLYAGLQHGARTMRAAAVHRWATGKGVTVAVVDTGVETEHPDLQGRVARTANFVEGGERTFTQDRHGTAVAGVIGASANNTLGIFGIAPQATLLAVKACWHPTPSAGEATCSSWSLARAVDFVMLQRAQVLNLSLTGPADPLLARLLTRAIAQGIVVVASVLATEQTGGFPAALAGVIAVGGERDPLHGTGNLATLHAPGQEIVTTVPQGTYDFLSGTSLAAAHVSGLVALLLERAPHLTAADLHTLLRTTSTQETPPGHPTPAVSLVNACAALGQLLALPGCE